MVRAVDGGTPPLSSGAFQVTRKVEETPEIPQTAMRVSSATHKSTNKFHLKLKLKQGTLPSRPKEITEEANSQPGLEYCGTCTGSCGDRKKTFE